MHLTIPEGPFAAYLFDCDGTIVDSMPLHYVAWKRALDEYGCPFPEAQFYAMGGLPVETVIGELNREHNLHMPPAETALIKESYYYELLADLKAIPEVLEQIHLQHGNIPLAVVSGSPRESVEASLGNLGILDKFETLVCAGDYTHGKPNPEPFLLAAKRLNVDPKQCLVFEDAQPGIDSAIAAGMQYVRIPLPHERLAAAEAAVYLRLLTH
jgi:HAD superfamily hydrolase (TIGR01509 family)